ncbi:ribosomal protein S6 kinase-related protein isoform X2 [Nematostella vectensis]|uniref:ribosomal protein S6 kinase-related protein isoform X2 n=1 Tax=Nematostella vectensis TaxID=45351 RepID=UPI0020771879|nr:ribosomal protein S6 kinase-related protein isoform X2 [Nematostella vectensis]
MGNFQTKITKDHANHKRQRPSSIAVDKVDKFVSKGARQRELKRDGGQSSFRRRYSESGNYSYKTPWPAPMSEVAFWPEYDSKPPVKFTDFQILATIGKGAFGHEHPTYTVQYIFVIQATKQHKVEKVLQVQHKSTDEVFAMKILNKAAIIKADAVQQCKEEVNIQMKLKSFPFLVKTFYTWQTKHNLFIVSDFVDGSDLFTLWKQDQVLPEELVKLYVAELALTLDFLHANGVIYRDLKLENVLLDRNGHAKIIDFGLSKLVTPGERRTTICGTLQYMAPEVLKGECYTAACDWWSLGIVMFTLLAGKYPYACQEDHNAQRNVVEETGYEVPSHVCESARDLLSQLLQKDPKLRLTSLESARSHPFFNCLSFDDVMAKKSKPLDEMTMKKLRRRSSASRMFFPRHVEQRKDRKPLSWASPGHFTIHDRVEMDFLVADLGSLSIMETPQDSNRDH